MPITPGSQRVKIVASITSVEIEGAILQLGY